MRDLFRGAQFDCGFPRDQSVVHSEHLGRALVAGNVNNDAIDEFDDAPHHLGAVEETAQNGFALAKRLVRPRELPPLNLAGDLPLTLQLGDSRPKTINLVLEYHFCRRRRAHTENLT